MLKQRVITAIILITLTLLILFYMPPAPFCILLGIISLAAAWEWTNLMEMSKLSHRLLYLVLMACVFFNAMFLPVTLILFTALLWWVFAIVLLVLYPSGANRWGKGYLLRGAMGVFVLLPCWAALNYIRNQNDGIYALLFLFILIWGADSAAYFAGNKWGKTKLAPSISPGKSIQGAIGAGVFAIIITIIALWLGQHSLQNGFWMVLLSLVTVFFSIVGDLFESMLKRRVNLKDSGRLLPGHGGLLDRIDSLTAAAPIFAFGALLLGIYL